MTVLVCDSSVLLEFAKHEILDSMFELDFQFAVPDLLFHEGPVDFGIYGRHALLGLGLRVEALDPDGVELAVSYQSRRMALSLADSSALALAHSRGWDLLTENRVVRSFGSAECITHRGVLWLIDQMSGAGTLSGARLMTVLHSMQDDPRCPVANHDLATYIRKLRKGKI